MLAGLVELVLFALVPGVARARSGRLRFLKVRHSTFLVDLDDVRVLLDPCFSRGLGFGPLVRAAEPAIREDALGDVDLLLVTSSRPDHLDPRAVAAIRGRRAYCMVPDEAAAKALRNAGLRRVRVVVPGDVFEVLGVTVHVSSAGRALGLWPSVGYRISHAGRSLWHTGPLPPLDGAPGATRFAQAHASEVVLGCADPSRILGRQEHMGIADAELLAALARARILVPAHDAASPTLLGRALGIDRAAPTRAPIPSGPRVIVAEPGVWYRVTPASEPGCRTGGMR